MSYCRSNGKDSDVYVIGTFKHLECFGAGWKLEDEKPVHNRVMVPSWEIINGKIEKTGEEHETSESFLTNSRQELIDHLKEHRKAGHKVPRYAFRRLRREIKFEGDEYIPHTPEPVK